MDSPEKSLQEGIGAIVSPHRSSVRSSRFISNVEIRTRRLEEKANAVGKALSDKHPREELLNLVRQCNLGSFCQPTELIALYARIRETSISLLKYTPPQFYRGCRIDDTIANEYLKHVNIHLECSQGARKVALLKSMTYFFTSRVFIDETSDNNELMKYIVSLVNDDAVEKSAMKSIILEIGCATVAGFAARAEPTATYKHVVSDAMYCMHKNSLLKPALEFAFQTFHSSGYVGLNLVFIDHVFECHSELWELIEDESGAPLNGYEDLFKETMTAGSKDKHSSLLIAQYREFEDYRSVFCYRFQPEGNDWYEDIYHTRPLAEHVCHVCHKDRCRVNGTLNDPSWMRCSRCPNRYLCSSSCRMIHRQMMCCGILATEEDVMYRATQFWFRSNACKFLHDMVDACDKYHTCFPRDLVLFVDFFPEVVTLYFVDAKSVLSGSHPIPFRYKQQKYEAATEEMKEQYDIHFPAGCTNARNGDAEDKYNGIVVFANYLDYTHPRGYKIMRLNMLHDSKGCNLISEDFVNATKLKDGIGFIHFVSQDEARKLKHEFGMENLHKKMKFPTQPRSTRMCRYEALN